VSKQLNCPRLLPSIIVAKLGCKARTFGPECQPVNYYQEATHPFKKFPEILQYFESKENKAESSRQKPVHNEGQLRQSSELRLLTRRITM